MERGAVKKKLRGWDVPRREGAKKLSLFRVVKPVPASSDPELEKYFQIRLSLVEGLGPVKSKRLIKHFGSAEMVFEAGFSELMRVKGVGKRLAGSFFSDYSRWKADDVLDYCRRNEIEILLSDMDSYPKLLRHCYDAPLVLYKKGAYNFNEKPEVGIVGTRTPSAYGVEMGQYFAESLAEQGVNIVSGLALGVDVVAHQAALGAGGTTVAVLGHGLDQVYPSQHIWHSKRIIENGALVTEFVNGTGPEAGNFPARNRIIAGICHGLVVVEAREKGGALITGRQAFEQGREVYAVPGAIGQETSLGCNFLIRDNVAKLLTSPKEILDDLEVQWDFLRGPVEVNGEEMSVEVEEDEDFEAEEPLVFSNVGEALQKLIEKEIEGGQVALPGNLF